MNSETALITGASSGIGLHLAHEFARHGHPLILVAPVAAELEEIAAHMKETQSKISRSRPGEELIVQLSKLHGGSEGKLETCATWRWRVAR